MPKIVLQPANPLDLRPEELEDLAHAIRGIDSNYEVGIAGEEEVDPRRRGVTWYEILTIWLPAVSGDISLLIIVGQAIAWARRRFQQQEADQIQRHQQELAQRLRRGRKPKPHITRRPKYIRILGPNGEVLKVVLVKDPESEPEDRTSDEQR